MNQIRDSCLGSELGGQEGTELGKTGSKDETDNDHHGYKLGDLEGIKHGKSRDKVEDSDGYLMKDQNRSEPEEIKDETLDGYGLEYQERSNLGKTSDIDQSPGHRSGYKLVDNERTGYDETRGKNEIADQRKIGTGKTSRKDEMHDDHSGDGTEDSERTEHEKISGKVETHDYKLEDWEGTENGKTSHMVETQDHPRGYGLEDWRRTENGRTSSRVEAPHHGDECEDQVGTGYNMNGGEDHSRESCLGYGIEQVKVGQGSIGQTHDHRLGYAPGHQERTEHEEILSKATSFPSSPYYDKTTETETYPCSVDAQTSPGIAGNFDWEHASTVQHLLALKDVITDEDLDKLILMYTEHQSLSSSSNQLSQHAKEPWLVNRQRTIETQTYPETRATDAQTSPRKENGFDWAQPSTLQHLFALKGVIPDADFDRMILSYTTHQDLSSSSHQPYEQSRLPRLPNYQRTIETQTYPERRVIETQTYLRDEELGSSSLLPDVSSQTSWKPAFHRDSSGGNNEASETIRNDVEVAESQSYLRNRATETQADQRRRFGTDRLNLTGNDQFQTDHPDSEKISIDTPATSTNRSSKNYPSDWQWKFSDNYSTPTPLPSNSCDDDDRRNRTHPQDESISSGEWRRNMQEEFTRLVESQLVDNTLRSPNYSNDEKRLNENSTAQDFLANSDYDLNRLSFSEENLLDRYSRNNREYLDNPDNFGNNSNASSVHHNALGRRHYGGSANYLDQTAAGHKISNEAESIDFGMSSISQSSEILFESGYLSDQPALLRNHRPAPANTSSARREERSWMANNPHFCTDAASSDKQFARRTSGKDSTKDSIRNDLQHQSKDDAQFFNRMPLLRHAETSNDQDGRHRSTVNELYRPLSVHCPSEILNIKCDFQRMPDPNASMEQAHILEKHDHSTETCFPDPVWDDELERLRRERRRIVEMLAKDIVPSKIQVELAEAQINYMIGQTDLLLQTIDEPCDWHISSLSRELANPDEAMAAVRQNYLKQYRTRLELSRFRIEKHIRKLEREHLRSQSRLTNLSGSTLRPSSRNSCRTHDRTEEQYGSRARSETDLTALDPTPFDQCSLGHHSCLHGSIPRNMDHVRPSELNNYLTEIRKERVIRDHNNTPGNLPPSMSSRSSNQQHFIPSHSQSNLEKNHHSASLESISLPMTSPFTTLDHDGETCDHVQESCWDEESRQLLMECQQARWRAHMEIEKAMKVLNKPRLQPTHLSRPTHRYV